MCDLNDEANTDWLGEGLAGGGGVDSGDKNIQILDLQKLVPLELLGCYISFHIQRALVE